jgi:hypothetical protein
VDDPDFNELTKIENIQRIREGNEPREFDFTAFKGWTTLLTLSYPLGNKSLGSAHRRARDLLEQSQRNLDDVERQLVLDLRTALRSLDNSVERVAILSKNIEGARSKLEYASVNFQLGALRTSISSTRRRTCSTPRPTTSTRSSTTACSSPMSKP